MKPDHSRSFAVLAAALLAVALLAGLGCGGRAPSAHQPAGSSAGQASRQVKEMTPPTAAIAAADASMDPTVTDPENYRAILDNERVRVLRYHDVPGTKTHSHQHPASVLYALSSFRRRLHFPDGTTRERDFQAGDVMWLPAQTHIGENIGTTNTEVLLVETKGE